MPAKVRTYALREQTPILRASLTCDHLSTSIALTETGHLLMHVRTTSYQSVDVVRFLHHRLRQIAGKILVIRDGSPIQRWITFDPPFSASNNGWLPSVRSQATDSVTYCTEQERSPLNENIDLGYRVAPVPTSYAPSGCTVGHAEIAHRDPTLARELIVSDLHTSKASKSIAQRRPTACDLVPHGYDDRPAFELFERIADASAIADSRRSAHPVSDR